MADTSNTFFEAHRDFTPWFLRGAWGQKWVAAWGTVYESIAELIRFAILARYPSTGPNDALPIQGAERQIRRTPLASIDKYRAQLVRARDLWRRGGTRRGIREALEADGFTVEINDNTQWTFDANFGDIENYWSRFGVLIRQPHGIGVGPICGDPTSICGEIVCGVTSGIEAVRSIQTSLAQWTGPTAKCVIVAIEQNGPICGASTSICGSIICGGTESHIIGVE